MKNDARILAYLILNQFEKTNSKLNQIINEVYVKYNPSNNIKSRSVVISNEVVRLRSRLDLMIEHVSGKSINYLDRPLKTILRIGFYEVVIDDEIPDYAAINSIVNIAKRNLNRKATGFTNAILRKLTRLKNILKPSVRYLQKIAKIFASGELSNEMVKHMRTVLAAAQAELAMEKIRRVELDRKIHNLV